MRKQRIDGLASRARLLEQGIKLFAQQGFERTTVLQISRVAQTNVAAVNYYFGSKEKLYVECWRESHQKLLVEHPLDGGIPADAPAEVRLRGQIEALVFRSLDEGSYSLDIANQELTNPTGLIRDIKKQAMKELREMLSVVIQEILGPKSTELDVQFCARSIMAQCHGHLVLRRLRWQSDSPDIAQVLLKQDKEFYARHVYDFSLAGIKEIKRQIESRGENDEKTQ